MHELAAQIGTVFMGFFAIMNPLANTPVFLALTAEDDAPTRRAVARNGLIVAFLIIALFSVGGKYIFELFGITLPAFRITGGVLVFGIGNTMLHGEPSKVHTDTGAPTPEDRTAQLNAAISPLAVPMLAGPGRSPRP